MKPNREYNSIVNVHVPPRAPLAPNCLYNVEGALYARDSKTGEARRVRIVWADVAESIGKTSRESAMYIRDFVPEGELQRLRIKRLMTVSRSLEGVSILGGDA